MPARETHKKRDQSDSEHGQSLAQKRWLHLACLVLACCSDVDPLIIPPLDPNDVDADGVPNDVDLCPETYDAFQHDEDGDTFGDTCDVCPATPDPAQSDGGEIGSFGFGDGIGDACDPRVARDGDVLNHFDSFATESARWKGEGWVITADVARTLGEARFESKEKLQGDGLYAEIEVDILTWHGPGHVDVTVNGDGVTAGVSCGVVHGPEGDEVVAREVDGLTRSAPIGSTDTHLTMTAWRVIDRDRNVTFFCRVAGVELEMPLGNEIPAGTYGFGSSGAITDVSSIVVYTFPINPCAFASGVPHACEDEF
jgi:hypothetical protein